MDNDARNQLLAQLRAAARELLEERNHERERAIEKMHALGARDDAETRKLLLCYLTQRENDLLRPLAASRLGEIGDKHLMHELIGLMDTVDDTELAVLVVQILAEIGDADAAPILIKGLHHGDSELRQRAAVALGKTGGEGAFAALMIALETETDLKARQQIIAALGWLGDEGAIPDLVQIMQTDSDKETQTFAAEALGRIGSERCFAPLLDTLQNQNYKAIVRYYAAYALGLMADPRAIDTLQQVANDPSEHGWVAQMAAESLEKFQ